MKKYIFCFAAFSAVLLFFNSCKKDQVSSGASGGSGNIVVRLTDAPGIYQQVNVDIQKISVHLVPDSGSASWIDLPTKSGVYNLLKLQNGIDTSLVNTTKLAAGKITQMRLILGGNNTVMGDSIMHSLTVPSGSESGIKLVGNLQVVANQTLVVKLDFDANTSVVNTGNNKFQLKPVIKTL